MFDGKYERIVMRLALCWLAAALLFWVISFCLMILKSPLAMPLMVASMGCVAGLIVSLLGVAVAYVIIERRWPEI